MSTDPFSSFGAQGGSSHPNPMFDFLTGFAPRKLKDLFRWVEYLYYNSAHIFAALKKFSEYPVTDLDIDSSDEALVNNWRKLLDEHIRIRSVSVKTGLDMHLYGNSFTSVYSPFNRFLVCNKCGAKSGIKNVKYKFKLKDMSFSYQCPACGAKALGKVEDKKVADKKRINIIRWDTKLMDINYNPITDESEYYYSIPKELKSKVEKGDAHIINTMPMEFLEAIQADKVFKFAPGQIYHMKIDAPAGIESQWGFPPLTSTIKLFFYAAVLRKANEAIALEHITPFRVLHPAAISGNADPSEKLNMAMWQNEMKSNIKQWRKDPLHIMFAPAALGVTTMGGQGRSLLTLGEVKEAEDNIIAAMGIPREFLYGGLSFTGSAITLRMLENQLETYTKHLNDQLQWIIAQVAKIMFWEPVDAKFTSFKLMDDAQQKASIMGLWQTLGTVSQDTLLTMHEIDINKERKKRKQEALDETRFQLELQSAQNELQTTLAEQAKAEAQGAGQAAVQGYNPAEVIGQADQLVAQLMQLPDGQRQSFLSHLSQEDPVMYAVVKDRMETQRTMQRQQAVNQVGM